MVLVEKHGPSRKLGDKSIEKWPVSPPPSNNHYCPGGLVPHILLRLEAFMRNVCLLWESKTFI